MILATGAKPIVLPVEGSESLIQANDVLSGSINILGGNVQSEATSSVIEQFNPQIVILATGAKPIVLPVEGSESLIQANDVLSGSMNILGGNVAIIGGGLVGLETAEYILHHARGNARVTLIEMMDAIVQGMVANNLVPTLKRFKEEGVQMITGAKVKSILDGTITVETKQGEVSYPGFTKKKAFK